MENSSRKRNAVKIVNIIFVILLWYSVNFSQERYFPETDLWYALLRGESISLSISVIVSIVILILIVVSFNKKIRFKLLYSKLLSICLISATLLLGTCNFMLTYYYDTVSIEENGGYTFTAWRIFQEPKNYYISDAALCHMESTSDIWIEMKNGERVYIISGVSTHSESFEKNYSRTQIAGDIHNRLKNEEIPLTIKNREKILTEIEKYQKRSDLKMWHEYLPQIVSNIP